MIKNFSRSLESLLGAEYTSAVCRARAALTGESEQALVKLAQENFNLAVEKLHVMKSTDGETADKLLAGTKKILETLIGRCG